MKLQNSFRDYTAESSLFVRRALVAFLGILLLTGVLIANLYNVQIVLFNDYQTRSNENRIKLVLAVAKERLNNPVREPVEPLTAEELAGGAPRLSHETANV